MGAKRLIPPAFWYFDIPGTDVSTNLLHLSSIHEELLNGEHEATVITLLNGKEFRTKTRMGIVEDLVASSNHHFIHSTNIE